MRVNKTDLAHSRNMLKVLGKGEWKLDGMEILAFADMMKWFSSMQKSIELEVSQEEASEKAKAVETEKLKAGIISPKPVEDVVKPIDVAKLPSLAPKVRTKKRS